MALRAKDPKKAVPKKPKILVYGGPGSGKTWGGTGFNKTVYVDCEGGASLGHYTDRLVESGSIYLGPADGANDFNVVLDLIHELSVTKHDYRTLVIDSFSKLFNTRIAVEYERMERAGYDLTKSFGAEKKPAVGATKQMIARFEKLDMAVLLICHQKILWQNGEQVGYTFDAWDKLEYELDLTIQIQKQGPKRLAKVGKCRLAQFKEGESFEWSYDEFAKRYGKDVMEAASTPVAPSTKEQVETATKLCEVVRLDEETKIKWFDKAGVSSWTEMDSETIQKCIEFLKSKISTAA